MAVRIEREVLYLRHDFSEAEQLQMAKDLAQAYNRSAQIDEEEQVMKTQVKDKRAGVDQTIGTLSRSLSTGWEMQNTPTTLRYDSPNVGEVSYLTSDGNVVKTRPMTEMERQLDLPLEVPATAEAEQKSVEASAKAAEEFFGEKGTAASSAPQEEATEQPQGGKPNGAVVEMPHKNGPKELAAYHEQQAAEDEAKGKKKGKGKASSAPTDAF